MKLKVNIITRQVKRTTIEVAEVQMVRRDLLETYLRISIANRFI